MLTLQAMILRLVAAVVLGAIVGLERETAHKQAGVRTDILVAAGAAIFSMIGLSLPYVLGAPQEIVNDILARNSGFLAVIANIVIGIGFLGAGHYCKTRNSYNRSYNSSFSVVCSSSRSALRNRINIIRYSGCFLNFYSYAHFKKKRFY